MKTQKFRNSLYLLATLLFVYVVLFEFVLPINRVFPKPSILIESFSHIFTYYNFASSLLFTIAIVYSAIVFGYLIIWGARNIVIKILVEYNNSLQPFLLFRYFPAFFAMMLFTFWFDSLIIAQLIFALFAFIFLVIQKISIEIPNVKREYVVIAENINPSKKYSEVYWHSILPELFCYMKNIHFYIWTLVILYEFVSNSFGIGGVYRSILEYNDFGALISVGIIISLVITLGSLLIHFAKHKLAFWES